ncbi:MAG: hypothetical protein HYX67_02940 [Candidatus Melainabacteria bacterium]|nr:hypothetical protein [Candidatus Melainabacteria bacterium]
MGKKVEACEAPVDQSSARDGASIKCSNEAYDQMRATVGQKQDDLYRFDGSGAKFPPALEIRDGSQDRQTNDAAAGQNSMANLFDKNASAQDKLASASQLYDSGARSITMTDKDGKEHKLRFEKLPVGDSGRAMVHVFGTDESGQERTVLRGISEKGGFTQERDQQGNFVDFYGRGKNLLDMTGAPQNQQSDRLDPNRTDDPNRQSGDRRPPYDPRRDRQDVCPQPNYDPRYDQQDPRRDPRYDQPDPRRDPRYDQQDPRRDPRYDQQDPRRDPRDQPDYRPNPDDNNPYRRNPNPDFRPDLSSDLPPKTSSHRALEPVTDPAILKDVGKRPDGSPIEPTYIGIDNSASYLGSDGKKHIQAGLPAWLDRPAAEAYVAINQKLARLGKHLQIASEEPNDGAINSAGRTHTQQRIATGIHAPPGNSVHEMGRGLDVRNYQDPDVRNALREFGFVQGNLSRPDVPIRGDAWHFSYRGRVTNNSRR